MSRTLLCAVAIALYGFISSFAMADDNIISAGSDAVTAANTTSEMSKDSWLNTMEPMLPEIICKGFMGDSDLKKRFDELKITYEQCASMIPDSVKKCRDELSANIPDVINTKSAGVWGKRLGECIGKDFAEQHLMLN